MRSALVPILLADPMPWAFKAPYAWDFLRDRARFAGGYRGALANTPNWTFTRASTGYAQTSGGVLVPFASGELRRTDKGVLIEGAGTNLCLRSQEFDNASWSKTRASISADTTTAPDGTTTADTLVEDSTASSDHRAQQSITIANTTAHAFSVYLKANTRSWSLLQFTDGTMTWGRYFDIGTGALGSAANTTPTTSSITALANGWYRCTITFTSTNTAGIARVYTANGDVGGTYSGDGASGIYLWGAQLEATAYASSYVPTTTGSVTRAADSLTVTGVTGLAYPLTFFCEFERGVDTGAAEALFDVSAGASTNEAYLLVGSTDLANGIVNATTQQMNATVTGALAVGTVYKAALRVATNDGIVARGGSLSTQDTSLTVPATPTTIRFGARVSDANPCYGYLRRLAIFSRALSDGELQALTAA